MVYEKMYLPREMTPQTVPAGVYTPDAYTSYAESFDLSLLPCDGEVPLSPESQITTIQPPFLSPEYIPTTIFHDTTSQSMSMKLEKSWLFGTPPTSQPPAQLPTNENTNSLLSHQLSVQFPYYPTSLPSPPQESFLTIFPPSPTPSLHDTTTNTILPTIKQEFGLLPPSPPDSSGAPSPLCMPSTDDLIKSEPSDTSDSEACIDIDSLLQNSLDALVEQHQQQTHQSNQERKKHQDHQLLREYLQDTTFQRKHNLKPLALESLIGGCWGTRGDIEPVISLALEQARRDVQATCAALNISPDPQQWTTNQTQSWLQSTIEQFKLSQIQELDVLFPEDGPALYQLSEEEFLRRAPQVGGTLYAQLEVWKAACMDVPLTTTTILATTTSTIPSTSNINISNFAAWSPDGSQSVDVSDDEDEEMPLASVGVTAATTGTTTQSVTTTTAATTTTPTTTTPTSGATSATPTPKTGRQGGSHIHLWQFLKELLASPQTHGTAIRWLDRTKGVFKIEDSVRVARLWGRRKNRPAMNYDKLSRSIRQYYKKGIMKKTERSQRLVYQFCHPYCL